MMERYKFRDHFEAVVPLAVCLALFLILILRQPVDVPEEAARTKG